MKPTIRFGKLFGVEVGLHYSWFLIALLITLSLTAQFHQNHPEWGESVIWAISILTALFFFAALLAHEMSHALMPGGAAFHQIHYALKAWRTWRKSRRTGGPEDANLWVGSWPIIQRHKSASSCLLFGLGGGWKPQRESVRILGMLVWLGYNHLMLAAFHMNKARQDGDRPPDDAFAPFRVILMGIVRKRQRDQHARSGTNCNGGQPPLQTACRIGWWVSLHWSS